MREVVVLGSTGSVGTQALDIVRANRHRFRVVGLAAGGANVPLLARQAAEFGVGVVGVAAADAEELLATAVEAEFDSGAPRPRLLAGDGAVAEVAGWPCHVVLNGITGSIGLAPTLAALRAGSVLALANKESLIVGGPLVKAHASKDQIVPVDSEHSALAQCLRAGSASEIRRLILTASGGPFRGFTADQLHDVTLEQALAHPTWDMGPVVTINSATMMNKALEVIEAHLLFDVEIGRIDVVVHPQSIVHSMVEFVDGSTVLQASPPDMRLPISLGLSWPERVEDAAAPCDWTRQPSWDFQALDEEVFGAVKLARTAALAGRTAPAVLNAANETCVEAFMSGDLGFAEIVPTVAQVLASHLERAVGIQQPVTIDDVLGAEQWARTDTRKVVEATR